jgi:hypothetical protein
LYTIHSPLCGYQKIENDARAKSQVDDRNEAEMIKAAKR